MGEGTFGDLLDVRRSDLVTSGMGLSFTESQGEFHAPWGACVGGKLFTVPGDEVGIALAALRSPLKRATLDRMMNDAERPG